MLSDGITSSCIPETNSFVKGRARKDRAIWGEGEGAYAAGVTCPRMSDLFSCIGVPTAVRGREEPAAVARPHHITDPATLQRTKDERASINVIHADVAMAHASFIPSVQGEKHMYSAPSLMEWLTCLPSMV